MLFGSNLKNYKQKQQGHKHLCIPLLLFCIGKNRVNYDIVRLQERGRLIVEERGETRDDGHITSDRSDPVQVPVQILVGGEDRKPVGAHGISYGQSAKAPDRSRTGDHSGNRAQRW